MLNQRLDLFFGSLQNVDLLHPPFSLALLTNSNLLELERASNSCKCLSGKSIEKNKSAAMFRLDVKINVINVIQNRTLNFDSPQPHLCRHIYLCRHSLASIFCLHSHNKLMYSDNQARIF